MAIRPYGTCPNREPTMNNIPSGYKQTEVGVIPEDWEVKRLEAVVIEN